MIGSFARWVEENELSTPDSIYLRKDAKAFFWIPNGGLFIGDRWSEKHEDMLDDPRLLKAIYGDRQQVDYAGYNAASVEERANLVRRWMMSSRQEALRFAVLGRVATDNDGIQKVAFWNKDANTARYIPKILQDLKQKTTLYDNAQVFYQGVPTKTVAEYIGASGTVSKSQPQSQPQDDDGDYSTSSSDWSTADPSKAEPNDFSKSCAALGIDMNGQPTTLGKLVGDLHMVKGDMLNRMRSNFCMQSKAIKDKIDAQGCNPEFWQVLHSKLGCDSMTSRSNWDTMVAQGRANMNNRARQLIAQGDYDAFDREFGDDLLKSFRGESFKEWLSRRVKHDLPAVRRIQEEVPAPARRRR